MTDEEGMNITLRIQADLRGDMKENRESLPIYITVDPTKILRCKWCGVVESEEWQHTRYGVYCSQDCFYADQVDGSSFPVLYYWAKVGMNRQKEVPRDSRRDDVSSDVALLKTISSGISCPRCNGNIDIRKIGTDRVYNCEYCGASGTIEVVKTH